MNYLGSGSAGIKEASILNTAGIFTGKETYGQIMASYQLQQQ